MIRPKYIHWCRNVAEDENDFLAILTIYLKESSVIILESFKNHMVVLIAKSFWLDLDLGTKSLLHYMKIKNTIKIKIEFVINFLIEKLSLKWLTFEEATSSRGKVVVNAMQES